jgi:hypothetical protein
MISWAIRYGTTSVQRQQGSVAELMRKLSEEEMLNDAVGKEGRWTTPPPPVLPTLAALPGMSGVCRFDNKVKKPTSYRPPRLMRAQSDKRLLEKLPDIAEREAEVLMLRHAAVIRGDRNMTDTYVISADTAIAGATDYWMRTCNLPRNQARKKLKTTHVTATAADEFKWRVHETKGYLRTLTATSAARMYVAIAHHLYPATLGHLASLQGAFAGSLIPERLMSNSVAILRDMTYNNAAAAIGNGFHVGCAARAVLQGIVATTAAVQGQQLEHPVRIADECCGAFMGCSLAIGLARNLAVHSSMRSLLHKDV